MEKFYHGKYDKAFKEVILQESNKDLLRVVLDKVLKEKISNIEYKPTEKLTCNVNMRGKRLDLFATIEVEIIDVEVNGYVEQYSRVRNIGNKYSSYTSVGKNYEEDINFMQESFSYRLSRRGY